MTTITWNFKSVKLPTTPMMPLTTLRDQAVTHFQLEGNFGLKKTSTLAAGRKPAATLLDLNDTVRLANFAQGQKLELVRLGAKKTASPAPVATQPATSETNKVVAPATPQNNMLSPVSVTPEDATESTDSPQTSTTQPDHGFTPSTAPASTTSSTAAPKKLLVNASLSVVSLPPSFSESLHSQFPPSTTIGQMLDFFQQKSGINFQRKLDIREAEDGHKVDQESYIRQGTYNVEFMDGHEQANESENPASKSVKVFEAGKSTVPTDDHDFEPTTAHAHAYISTIRKTGGTNKSGSTLLTEKLRDQQRQAKINQLGSVKVRLRFPDGVYVETEYSKNDTVGSMVDTVNNVLGGDQKFRLWQSYPRKELNDVSLRLMTDLGFLTNTLVTVEFPGLAKFDSKAVLKPGVVVETPKPVESDTKGDVPSSGGPSTTEAKPKRKMTGTPKWLKLGKK
ncbi:GLUT4 regulating protein TUG-domain-containing protein [Yarrowia lipolytica]|jgi:hypothetical protein|uniref:YALI0E28556p n=2 Tax=Yarrowia lipolytica TaxID=4952 RepID=Q6C499_YARLI|nr:YALI0E28556p [Yarrowia lipolytica CLIB122]AOW06092.1 hypothetical protein YALI1_E33829g [Yarrowia lipolytica]KAB8285634.1 GLUT4 regulating protein TUG-domain-containing protein [Yarrowia lipolytica]KAE8175278.1 GLUT4 regulating protein TUG-domain-containing protein [Yarrowia lipolytica]KAJ8057489.1 GLUT4 regulating protein TUG-domain-containing protein [Yarrowia lipolytica]RDW42179.1 GLUT4 regulating protein TUG-domain-containing protein [Yarrowia lipolytica]|eukprot:XP_504513.1 YALI0E28556p [Yarrowia lipolytica CLIB122]